MTTRFLGTVLCGLMLAPGAAVQAADPQLTLPSLPRAPVLDGRVAADEWQYAAAVSGLEAVETGSVRAEQTVFYLGRHGTDLYVGMQGTGSTYDRIMAGCAMRDNRLVCGDDAVELMFAPGRGEALADIYFPTYYLVVNPIGTVFDMKLRENANEEYFAWNLPLETAAITEGSTWQCELRIPLRELSPEPVVDGTVWRMNFTRAHAGFVWTAWVPGYLNTYKTGGDVTFDSRAPAVRLLSVQPLLAGRNAVQFEVANPTETPTTVTLSLETLAVDARQRTETPIGKPATARVEVPPEASRAVTVGAGEALAAANRVLIRAVGADGRPLLSMERRVNLPAPSFPVMKAPAQKFFQVDCRFLPSLERLAVHVNGAAWIKSKGVPSARFTADVKVFTQGAEAKTPLLSAVLKDFADAEGTCRLSTKDLPEGEYSVAVLVKDAQGKTLQHEDDWFVKKTIPYLASDRRGVGADVPPPFTPLEVSGREIRPWGRVYRFSETGLPVQMVSQGKELLAAPTRLNVMTKGAPAAVSAARPLAVTKHTPAAVEAGAEFTAGDVKLSLASTTEYDGLTRFRLTYGPAGRSAELDAMAIEIPLRRERARFFSAVSDFLGDSREGVLPEGEGVIHDSLNGTRSVAASPPFSALFWVGDHDVCFCYCADSDEGWVVDDRKPELEVERRGDVVTLRLNLVSGPYTLQASRTLEFGLQAGPVKPLPDDWRSYQFEGDPRQAANVWGWFNGVGAWGLGGGTHLLHPGDTPEIRDRAKAAVARAFEGDARIRRVGYCWFPHPPKGRVETKVYRGEWGITGDDWRSTRDKYYLEHYKQAWETRAFGDDPDLYVPVNAAVTPSLIDFYVYCWDETLTAVAAEGFRGFYYDQGYPRPVFDPELGLGYVRDDGRKCYATGLWLIRDLYKRLAYVNYLHKLPNFLADAQHYGHNMPCYGFLGIFAPCEGGYYGAVLDKVKSMDYYAALTPAKQFGQIPQIGLTPLRGADRVGFAWETRELVMMAMLHDHDLGSWGGRDMAAVNALRACRNRLLPWQPDVAFTGYWEAGGVVQTGHRQLLASVYTCPRGVLLVFGNVSKENIEATVTIDWQKLGIDRPQALIADAEDAGRRLNLSPEGKLTLFVPTRGLRLVAATPKPKARQ